MDACSARCAPNNLRSVLGLLPHSKLLLGLQQVLEASYDSQAVDPFKAWQAHVGSEITQGLGTDTLRSVARAAAIRAASMGAMALVGQSIILIRGGALCA